MKKIGQHADEFAKKWQRMAGAVSESMRVLGLWVAFGASRLCEANEGKAPAGAGL